MDQFTYAERATDWRGNNNIAESLFAQMRLERYPAPRWVVVSAGTGGTSLTLGRYMRYSQRALGCDAALRGRSRELGVLRFLSTGDTGPAHREKFADRGHRPSPRRGVVHRERHRPHDPRAGRRLDRRDPLARDDHRPQMRRLDRNQSLRRPHPRGGDDRARPPGLDRHAHLRSGRAVSRAPTTTRTGSREKGLDPRPYREWLERFTA